MSGAQRLHDGTYRVFVNSETYGTSWLRSDWQSYPQVEAIDPGCTLGSVLASSMWRPGAGQCRTARTMVSLSPYQGLLPDACSGANWRGRRSPPHGLQ
jgi:hypothetical protein